jgi:hypothetical protein
LLFGSPLTESILLKLSLCKTSFFSLTVIPMVETETMMLQDREFHNFQITRLARRLSVMDSLLAAAGAKKAIPRASREIKSAGSSGCHES